MSSYKWGPSQMLGTASTKTVVDYKDRNIQKHMFAPVGMKWCEGNQFICQIFWFLDTRTEIDTVPLTHWKNLGWNWDILRSYWVLFDPFWTSLGIPPLERAMSAGKSHNSHAEDITTRVPNTSPAGRHQNSAWGVLQGLTILWQSQQSKDECNQCVAGITSHRTSRSLEEYSQECRTHLLCCL